jgi:CheY-like chemotaxis protein/HPt (histidine-containing phosphotransfer) domain-containing protein
MGAPAATEVPLAAIVSEPTSPGWKTLHILLAEDNLVNQKLATRLLEKQGHTVVVAEDGRKALAAFEGAVFDLVLMDVQMPEMNGFEVTAAIREIEKVTGSHVPIVAMTAHALKGDRERCLDAGMDDYVSKPIRTAKLTTVIEKLTRASAPRHNDARTQVPLEEVFNAGALLERVDGDANLLRYIVELFLEELPRLLADVRDAVAGGDSEALERAAHKLRGSAGNFDAAAVGEAALRLETMAREGNTGEAAEAVAALEYEVGRFKPALISFGKEQLIYEGLDR